MIVCIIVYRVKNKDDSVLHNLALFLRLYMKFATEWTLNMKFICMLWIHDMPAITLIESFQDEEK